MEGAHAAQLPESHGGGGMDRELRGDRDSSEARGGVDFSERDQFDARVPIAWATGVGLVGFPQSLKMQTCTGLPRRKFEALIYIQGTLQAADGELEA